MDSGLDSEQRNAATLNFFCGGNVLLYWLFYPVKIRDGCSGPGGFKAAPVFEVEVYWKKTTGKQRARVHAF